MNKRINWSLEQQTWISVILVRVLICVCLFLLLTIYFFSVEFVISKPISHFGPSSEHAGRTISMEKFAENVSHARSFSHRSVIHRSIPWNTHTRKCWKILYSFVIWSFFCCWRHAHIIFHFLVRFYDLILFSNKRAMWLRRLPFLYLVYLFGLLSIEFYSGCYCIEFSENFPTFLFFLYFYGCVYSCYFIRCFVLLHLFGLNRKVVRIQEMLCMCIV